MNTASNGFRPRQAGTGEAGKRAVLIQALIVSRRLRARARLASRAATRRDAPASGPAHDQVRDAAPPGALLVVPVAAQANASRTGP